MTNYTSRLSRLAYLCMSCLACVAFDATAQVLCVRSTAKIAKNRQMPLGSQFTVRPTTCAKNEVGVVNVGQFAGIPGGAGAVGSTGASGPAGDKGDKGLRGEPGPRGAGVRWGLVSTDIQMESNRGYIVSSREQGEVNLRLPSDPAVGDVIRIREGAQLTNWKIVPGVAGQTIDGYEGIYSAGGRNWQAMAVSPDGTNMAAADFLANIYTSSDGGSSWTIRPAAGERKWSDIAISGDGRYLAAVESPGYIHTSADRGQTWTRHDGITSLEWAGVAVSEDGSRMLAAPSSQEEAVPLYFSDNYGATWSANSSSMVGDWQRVALSSGGQRAVATGFAPDGQAAVLVTSADGGVTWQSREAPAGKYWEASWSFGLSSDGLKIAAMAGTEDGGASFVAVSSNGGSSWLLNPSRLPFRSLGMSGDGQVIYGVFNGYDEANQQGVYRSTDGGVSWAFLKRDKGFERIGGYGFQRIMANSDGSVWYGIRRKAGLGGELLLFSSAIRSFTELNGYGTFRLIYRGGGVFGVD